MPFRPTNPKASFPEIEKEILEFWEKEKIFEKSLEKESPKGDFVFFEGPPTANGKPGVHHVLARAFKDILPRYKTMQGYHVARKAGWDTHGLPVELEVEKKLGISGKPQIESIKDTKEESIAEFNRLCKEDVWKYKTDWEQMTKRMGFWVDMEHPYITYENDYIESVWWVLSQAFEKKLVYKGYKVVPYCPRCGTALSSHEVAQGYKEIEENSVYVEFTLKSGQKIGDKEITNKTHFLVWTTTPWTLPGNVAVAVGKDIQYALAKGGRSTEDFIIAKSRIDAVFKGEGGEIIGEFTGEQLLGLEYEPLYSFMPIDKKAHFVISGDFVSDIDGTGIVHIAPTFGEDDYNVGVENDLPVLMTLDKNGRFLPEIGEWGGKGAKESDPSIIQDLQKRNILFSTELYTHDYPFCWRCDTALLYYAKDSWFIAMSKLREELKKNNENINWVPENIKNGRFGEWLDGAKDWAISRDRYWGTPLPFWQCQNGKSEARNPKFETCEETICIKSVEELKEKASNFSEVYPDEKNIDLHKPYIDKLKLKCECGGEMTRTPEVADCWLDSGSMPYAQWHYPMKNKELIDGRKFFPADFISEAIDQTRGWFYTLHAISTFLGLGCAYKNVICLGHIMDAKGQKMSKSKGNILDPIAMAESHGFDAIRWYLYTNNQPGETKLVSEEAIKDQVRRFLLILWNTYSFFVTYGNMKNFTKTQTTQNTNLFDKWLVSKKNRLIKKVTENLDEYDVFTASRAIEEFVIELSTWYLRRNKKREGTAFLAVLHETLVDVAKLLAPFAPFISESIYQNLTGESSVHLSTWPTANESLLDEKLEKEMEMVKKIVELGHSIRKEKGIKVRQPLGELQIVKHELSKELLDIIAEEVNVKSVRTGRDLSENNWATKEDGGVAIALNLEITPELKKEGLMRDIVRLIQDARKEAKYAFDEKVNVFVATESPEIKQVFADFDEEIKKQTALSDISTELTDKFDIEKEGDLDGEKIKIQLAR